MTNVCTPASIACGWCAEPPAQYLVDECERYIDANGNYTDHPVEIPITEIIWNVLRNNKLAWALIVINNIFGLFQNRNRLLERSKSEGGGYLFEIYIK